MQRRAFVLLNARAGGADRAALDAALDEGLKGSDWTWDVFERHKGQGRRKACRRACDDGYDVLIAAGGDGTVCRVADVAVERDVAAAVLPMGTANLVARELGVPSDLREALGRSAISWERPVDCMNIGKRRLLSKVSMGSYAEIVQEIGKDDKKQMGRMAYVGPILREFANLPTWRYQLTIDGDEQEIEASAVLIANVGAVGVGNMRWSDRIEPDDGVLDVLIVTPDGLLQLADLAAHAATDAIDMASCVQHLEARHRVQLNCVSDDRAIVRGDGKKVGRGSVDVELEAKAVRMLRPAVALNPLPVDEVRGDPVVAGFTPVVA